MEVDLSHATISDYSSEWPEKFKRESEILNKIFGSELIGTHHIGSTAVPDLVAKSIIDIAVVVDTPETAERFIYPLEKFGYRYDQPASSGERHFFRKGNPTEYHLSICYTSRGGFLRRQLLFRDYLLAHPETREEYSNLKRELIKQDPTGKNGFISSKGEFIKKVLKEAGFE